MYRRTLGLSSGDLEVRGLSSCLELTLQQKSGTLENQPPSRSFFRFPCCERTTTSHPAARLNHHGSPPQLGRLAPPSGHWPQPVDYNPVTALKFLVR